MTTRSFHRTMIRTRHMGAMYKHGFGYTTLTSQNSEEARGGQHEYNRNRCRATPSCRSSSPAEVPEVGRRNIALVYEFFANSRRAVQNVPWRFVVSGAAPIREFAGCLGKRSHAAILLLNGLYRQAVRR